MKISGVYLIINKLNGNFYVGSSNDLESRFRTHRSDLKHNRHSSILMQRVYNKYGISNLKFETFIECDIEDKLILEQFCLDFLNPGYNISINALAPMQGRKHSQKTLDKLRGRKPWNKGISRTEEEKLLMSKNRKIAAKNMSEKSRNAWIQKIKDNPGNYWKDKKIPEYIRSKVRNSWLKKINKVKCIECDEIFDSQKEASLVLGLKQGHISEHLNGFRLNVKGYTFEYI